MASAKLSAKALGSIVKVNENGTAAEFVVACHNYEARLNGSGRTLLVRKTSLEDRELWAQLNSTTNLDWNVSHMKYWVGSKYIARLDEEIRRNLGKTNYYYSGANSAGRIQGSAFLLSAYELTGERQYADSSTKLDDAVLRVLESGGGSPWWTRSVWPEPQKENGDKTEDGRYTRVCLYGKSDSDDKWSIYKSGVHDAESADTATIRPCFTVPEDMRVYEDGTLRESHAPVIINAYQNAGTMGTCGKGFSIPYAVYDDDVGALTVTEYVDGIQLRRFVAQNGQQLAFTLDENVFEQLATEKQHAIKITAENGIKTAEWTQTFFKTEKLGYRVYAGTLTKGSPEDYAASSGLEALGIGKRLMYKWATRECIYDPTCVDDERDNIIIDPQLEMEKNELGSFEFTLPVSSHFYNSLIPRRTVVSVEEDGVEIWMGYVAEIDKDFQMEKKVYCEGELGFLKDISLVLEPKEYTAYELYSAIISTASAKGWKSFKLGKTSGKLKNIKVNLKESGTQYTTVWDALKNILLGNVGGMLYVRKEPSNIEGGYVRYLDYFLTEDELGATTQCIEFGKNLLDLDYYVKAYDIVNRVTYHGYETKGWWIFSHTDKISVTVEDAKSVEIYGPIERCYVADGTASTEESLRKAAKKKLDELKLKMDYSFEISALDLRDAGVDVMRLGFMKRAQILSWPHELNQYALCTKLSIPLERLDEKKFTFGSASETLSGQQATGTGVVKRAVDTLRSVVNYINR